jgi:predicted DNA-binding protein (UPF0278 family)
MQCNRYIKCTQDVMGRISLFYSKNNKVKYRVKIPVPLLRLFFYKIRMTKKKGRIKSCLQLASHFLSYH